MFRIFDGREHFYQWDLNQKLIINDNSITEVHFCNRTDDCSLVCEVYTEDGKRLVNVPNVLLQNDWPIRVFAYAADHTKTEAKYKVISRSKPADYVYTETEVKTFELLEQRMEELENSVTEEGISKAVEDYLADNPITMDDYYTKEEMEERVATYTETVISPIVADTSKELERLDMKIDRSVPTKVSQLENDSNYLTEEQANGVLEEITTGLPQTLNGVLIESKQYTDSVIPKNVSALNNDKGYQTAAEVEAAVEEAISGIEIPEGASNKPLTFTGAVSAVYDGTEAVSVNIPSGGGGSSAEVWDILLNVTTEEDVVSVANTIPPNGHSFDEYTEIVAILFVTPNAYPYTTGIKLSLNGTNPWMGSFTFPLSGIKDGVGRLGMVHLELLSFGWIPKGWYSSYNVATINNNLVPQASGTTGITGCNFATNTIPEDMTNVLVNYPISAVCIGGYQKVLGAGTKAIVYGKRNG